MKDIEIQVRCECPACKGSGTQRNPDYNENEQFLQEKNEPCGHCNGLKKVVQWISLVTFLTTLQQMDFELDLENEMESIVGEQPPLTTP